MSKWVARPWAESVGCDHVAAHNHWFDCVVGCAAGPSMQSAERVGAQMKPSPERERLKLSELQMVKRR